MPTKESIISQLKRLKPHYAKEGLIIEGLFGSYARGEATEESDADVLVQAQDIFVQRYGFGAIDRLKSIEEEISQELGISVDLASSSGMGKTAKKFILDRTIYL